MRRESDLENHAKRQAFERTEETRGESDPSALVGAKMGRDTYLKMKTMVSLRWAKCTAHPICRIRNDQFRREDMIIGRTHGDEDKKYV